MNRKNLLLWLSLAAYVWLFVLTTFFSIGPAISFLGTFEKDQGQLIFLGYILLFFLVTIFLKSVTAKPNTKKIIEYFSIILLITCIGLLSFNFLNGNFSQQIILPSQTSTDILDITLSLGVFTILAQLTLLFLIFRTWLKKEKDLGILICLITLVLIFITGIFGSSTIATQILWWLNLAIIFSKI